MKSFEKIYPGVSVTDFWRIIDDLPEVIDGKEYKKLVKEYFDRDGKSTKKSSDIKTDEQFQIWNDINEFARLIVSKKLPVQKLRDRRESKLAEISRKKESNREKRRSSTSSRNAEES